MDLPSDLISEFVKTTNDKVVKSSESLVYGTVANVSNNGDVTVYLDGSNIATPVSSMVEVRRNERVMVQIKDHSASIIGNMSSPAMRLGTLNEFAATLDSLYVGHAEIEELIAGYATIENLEATNATIANLSSTYATITNLDAAVGRIDTLESTKADITHLATNYANIDFANIGEAAIKKIYADTGIIKNGVYQDGTFTGDLAGVRISGDLITAHTLYADRIVISGEDGLYYELNMSGNVSGLRERTVGGTTIVEKNVNGTWTQVSSDELSTIQNRLHGENIIAQSVTADKISVSDLNAFNATIGGLVIGSGSIHSAAKDSITNSTNGLYFDSTGQMYLGNATDYIKYYKDSNNNYQLDIRASRLTFGANNQTIQGAFDAALAETVYDILIEYALSNSPSVEPSSGWSTTAPTWQEGKYMWQKTTVTYGDGHSSTETTCISGATGATGPQGQQGAFYGTCSTEAYYSVKEVITEKNVPFETGTILIVKFINKNSYNSPDTTQYFLQLKVNGRNIGVKNNGAFVTLPGTWDDGDIVTFRYVVGTGELYWEIVSVINKEPHKTADNFMSFDSSNGLLVYDRTAASMGKNVQIKSSGINFRDGDTDLATFSANTIELGKNSDDSVIKFCNDKGELKVQNNLLQLSAWNISGIYLSSSAQNSSSNSGLLLTNSSANIYNTVKRDPSNTYSVDDYPNSDYGFQRTLVNGIEYYSANNVSETANNASYNSTYAYCIVSFNLETAGNITIYFDYNTESPQYDYGTISELDSSSIDSGTPRKTNIGGSNGTDSVTFESVSAGSHSVRIRYRKDSSQNPANEKFRFRVEINTAEVLNDSRMVLMDNYIYMMGERLYLNNKELAYVPGKYIDIDIQTAGFVTTSGKDIFFTIPIQKPLIGVTSVIVSSAGGMRVRQNNSYLVGSGTEFNNPSTYSGTLEDVYKNTLTVQAHWESALASAVNNDSCGVHAKLRLTFV